MEGGRGRGIGEGKGVTGSERGKGPVREWVD